MVKSLITDIVTDIVTDVRTLLAFVRTSTLRGRTWRVIEMIFVVLYVQLFCSFFESYNWL
jgi:hypothetical protein